MANILLINPSWRPSYKNILSSFSPPFKVVFIYFNHSTQKDFGFLSCQYSQPNYCNNFKNYWIAQSYLLGDSSCRDPRFKELNNKFISKKTYSLIVIPACFWQKSNIYKDMPLIDSVRGMYARQKPSSMTKNCLTYELLSNNPKPVFIKDII